MRFASDEVAFEASRLMNETLAHQRHKNWSVALHWTAMCVLSKRMTWPIDCTMLTLASVPARMG